MELKVLSPGIAVLHNSVECDDEFIQNLWEHRYREERNSEWREDGKQDPNRQKYYENNNLPVRVTHTPHGEDWDADDPYDAFMLGVQKVYLKCLVEYGNMYPCLFNDLQWQEAHRLLNYVPGAKMGAHSDNTPGTIRSLRSDFTDPVAATRLVVCITFLNDRVEDDEDPGEYGYSGGEVYLPYVGVNYNPLKGDTIMYPANYLYAHGVETVLDGNRIANLTVFCQGDFRRLPVAPERPPRRPWIGGEMFIEFVSDDFGNVVEAKYQKGFPCHPTHF